MNINVRIGRYIDILTCWSWHKKWLGSIVRNVAVCQSSLQHSHILSDLNCIWLVSWESVTLRDTRDRIVTCEDTWQVFLPPVSSHQPGLVTTITRPQSIKQMTRKAGRKTPGSRRRNQDLSSGLFTLFKWVILGLIHPRSPELTSSQAEHRGLSVSAWWRPQYNFRSL